MNSKNLLESLPNEQLSSVEFVQDYLQLHFEDKTLTCYIWPYIKSNDQEYRNGDAGYKDQICNLIANRVLHVAFIEHVALTITFLDASEIILSLDSSNVDIVGEIAILSDTENNWSIFE